MNHSRNALGNTMHLLWNVSRPRFWMYVGGPVLIGGASSLGIETFYTSLFWYILFIFLIPANIFLYGVNDISDQDTDRYNDKKQSKETRYATRMNGLYTMALGISFLFLCSLFPFLNAKASIFLTLFLFLSYAYSAKPFRFKAKPIFDFSSNILYVMPGFLAYSLFTNQFPSSTIILTAFLWTSAMHLFSAIPDIKADARAKLQTSAVVLGETKSLLLVFLLWMMCSLSLINYTFIFLLSLVYPMLPLGIIFAKWDIKRIYWLYPYITPMIGFFLFWYIIFT